jgi:[ribosomal protein S5]-alanine N-acetyltransferase
MSRDLPRLHSARAVLRLAEPHEAPAVLCYYEQNRKHLAPWDPLRPADFYTLEFWLDRIQADVDEFHADRSVRFFLFEPELERTVLGCASFTSISRGVFQSCNLGYSLGAAVQGKGLMTEALAVALRYMFDELNLHRVAANYMPRNVRSGAVLRRLGFTIEGQARDYLRIAGRWEDHVLTSLTNRRWRPSEA